MVKQKVKFYSPDILVITELTKKVRQYFTNKESVALTSVEKSFIELMEGYIAEGKLTLTLTHKNLVLGTLKLELLKLLTPESVEKIMSSTAKVRLVLNNFMYEKDFYSIILDDKIKELIDIPSTDNSAIGTIGREMKAKMIEMNVISAIAETRDKSHLDFISPERQCIKYLKSPELQNPLFCKIISDIGYCLSKDRFANLLELGDDMRFNDYFNILAQITLILENDIFAINPDIRVAYTVYDEILGALEKDIMAKLKFDKKISLKLENYQNTLIVLSAIVCVFDLFKDISLTDAMILQKMLKLHYKCGLSINDIVAVLEKHAIVSRDIILTRASKERVFKRNVYVLNANDITKTQFKKILDGIYLDHLNGLRQRCQNQITAI